MDDGYILELIEVNKEFKDLRVVKDINISLKRQEIISILGPSGCGKSTILRLIAGLDLDYQGDIVYKGERIAGPSVKRGIVFQEPRLFPWLDVRSNIAFGLKEGLRKEDREVIVEDYLDLLDLGDFSHHYPKELSGGMQQRVSIGRSLVNGPELLLLDEPFGALDAMTRFNMQNELLKIWKKEDLSIVLVTHDIEEAIYLSDRIVVLTKLPGEIAEILEVKIDREERLNSLKALEMKEDIYIRHFKDRDL